MNLNEYQEKAAVYDLSQPTMDLKSPGFVEKALGLVGEAGETADKVKKIIRDKNGAPTDEDKTEIVKELGDVLWYVSNLARYVDTSLEDVAKMNLDKLESRKNRNLLHGAGDNR